MTVTGSSFATTVVTHLPGTFPVVEACAPTVALTLPPSEPDRHGRDRYATVDYAGIPECAGLTITITAADSTHTTGHAAGTVDATGAGTLMWAVPPAVDQVTTLGFTVTAPSPTDGR
ncbi:MAG: hypothetical protein QG661_2952 [Actinomycetota bacterium]|jgi:hypothetical protein|nr:hypothetical protein [Actinomycetota bacterium]MDQ5975743.1 hypothetical protein [Actinomycetota bacterium]